MELVAGGVGIPASAWQEGVRRAGIHKGQDHFFALAVFDFGDEFTDMDAMEFTGYDVIERVAVEADGLLELDGEGIGFADHGEYPAGGVARG
jgi:hypothetical protein